MNEAMDIAKFEQLVRERAYALWEKEGRSHGRDVEHWLASEEATRAELAASAAEAPVAEAAPLHAAAAPVAEAIPVAPVVAAKKAPAKVKAAPRKKKVVATMASPIRPMSATLQ